MGRNTIRVARTIVLVVLVQRLHSQDTRSPAFFITGARDDVLVPCIQNAATVPFTEDAKKPGIRHDRRVSVTTGTTCGAVSPCRDDRGNGEDAKTVENVLRSP